MSTPWAALEARTNATALALLGELVVVDGVQRRADFCEPHELATVGGIGMVGGEPQLTLLAADLPASPLGKAVHARGRNYAIADVRRDGRGLAVLMLSNA